MTSELKPCPFCGVNGLPHSLDHEEGCYLWYFYEILTMGSQVSGGVVREAWNTRAKRTCRYKHIEGTWFVGECGERYNGVIAPNYCSNCGAEVVE